MYDLQLINYSSTSPFIRRNSSSLLPNVPRFSTELRVVCIVVRSAASLKVAGEISQRRGLDSGQKFKESGFTFVRKIQRGGGRGGRRGRAGFCGFVRAMEEV